MHPLGVAEVLYDGLGGAITDTVDRSRREFERGPVPSTTRQHALRLKILRKFMRRAKARAENKMIVSIAAAQFAQQSVRFWFESRNEWPLPLHVGLDVIRDQDHAFAAELEIICQSDETKAKIDAMERVYGFLSDPGWETSALQ